MLRDVSPLPGFVTIAFMEHAHTTYGTFFDVVVDSLLDTVYLIPFLLVTYLAMEWLEHKAGGKAQAAIKHAGAAGPAVGALVGAFPQCGFSAAAATLYAGRVVTLGTLFAVFLSTSDEMLPIFLAEQVDPVVIAKVLGTKVVIGMLMGFLIDAALRLARRDNQKLRIHELCEHDHCGCASQCATCAANPELAYGHRDDCSHGCDHSHHEHNHEHDHDHGSIVRSALAHTLQVTLFVFVVSLVLNAVLAFVGEEALASFLSANPTLAVFGAALVGLIPNCAASVVVAQLYIEGVLGAGAMLAGLLVGAGVGLLVLVRANRRPAQNAAIVAGLYATGVFWGLAVNVLGI
nr:putative manganese transporter [Adlercreutzia sp. ZJ138]